MLKIQKRILLLKTMPQLNIDSNRFPPLHRPSAPHPTPPTYLISTVFSKVTNFWMTDWR